MDDQRTILKLLFSSSESRSQVVFVGRVTTGDGQEWAMIASVFAVANRVDLSGVLDEAGEYPVGGVVKMGDRLAAATQSLLRTSA